VHKKANEYIKAQLELIDQLDEIERNRSMADTDQEILKNILDTLKEIKRDQQTVHERLEELEGKEEGKEEEITVKKEKKKIDSPVKIKPIKKATISQETEDLTESLFKEKKKSRGQHEKEFLKDAMEICEEDNLVESRIYEFLKQRSYEIIQGEVFGWKKNEKINRLIESGMSLEELKLRSEIGSLIPEDKPRYTKRGGYRGRGRGGYRGKGKPHKDPQKQKE
jgi:hypothetical protein